MTYVDGFVLPLAKKHVAAYKRMATRAGKIWIEYGALDYRECVGEDLNVKGMASFSKAAKAKTGETVIFAWITYRSRAHRDKVMAKIMADPRMVPDACVPMDPKRMMYGGFEVLVDRKRPAKT
ncbi:MAG: DUF1428 domain-containing protein [Parvibaculum sp.]|nr:DUF1428 domain-containing protein [Parvibaculum sp.]